MAIENKMNVEQTLSSIFIAVFVVTIGLISSTCSCDSARDSTFPNPYPGYEFKGGWFVLQGAGHASNPTVACQAYGYTRCLSSWPATITTIGTDVTVEFGEQDQCIDRKGQGAGWISYFVLCGTV